MATKRTLDAFFLPTSKKKARVAEESAASNAIPDSISPEEPLPPSVHPTYPFPIPRLPPSLANRLSTAPASPGRIINNQPDLDLVYYEPYIPKGIEKQLFHFLRKSLPFYRVEYKIQRGGVPMQIRTPRFTTVFGVDETSKFMDDGSLVDAVTGKPVLKDRYRCRPRPIPACLEILKKNLELHLNEVFNFCLVNYYASGEDSISYHSDDELFLGPNPTIASFSLGAPRDFLMKHKPLRPSTPPIAKSTPSNKPLKFTLDSGTMILMKGSTQREWLHSIPKRTSKSISSGGKRDVGRINITFRKALGKGGTENYYIYNVGLGSSSSSASLTSSSAGGNGAVGGSNAVGGSGEVGGSNHTETNKADGVGGNNEVDKKIGGKGGGGVYRWDDTIQEMTLWE